MKRDRPAAYVHVDPAIETRWPGADAEATELAINLFVLNGRLSAFSQDLCDRYRVPSPAAFNVLTILEGAGQPQKPSAIADRMLVTRPTMTGIVESLERRKLVRTRPHPTDGRASLVELTAGGRRRVHAMRPALHAAEKRWMRSLSADERRRLRGILATLLRHMPTV